MNMQDVLLDSKYKDMVDVIPVSTLKDVLDNILVSGARKEGLLEKLTKFLPSSGISGKTVNPAT